LQITGIWLAAKTHGSGMVILEKLAFLPDGTGTYSVHDWALQYYDNFEWELTGESEIRITGKDRFFMDSERTTVLKTDSSFDFPKVSFSISGHQSGEEAVDVLRMDLGPDYSNTFFLSKDPVESYTPPAFSRPD
jgi:hypothetical protein